MFCTITILKVGNLLNRTTTSALFINEKLTDTKVAEEAITERCLNCWDTVKTLFEFSDVCGENTNKRKYFLFFKIFFNYIS